MSLPIQRRPLDCDFICPACGVQLAAHQMRAHFDETDDEPHKALSLGVQRDVDRALFRARLEFVIHSTAT